MSMSKYVCKREDVCAGKLFKENNIYYEDGSKMDTNEPEKQGYKYDGKLYCRHILFNVGIHNFANDLVYKSPLYPIDGIYPTIDFDCEFLIEDMVNLEKVLKYMNYNESLTQEDINDIYKYLKDDTNVIGIDEAQFFSEDIIKIGEDLVSRGIRVIFAGLDTDFRGEPFGSMPILMARAERVDKLHAICMVCGGAASRTQRLVNGEPAHYDDPLVIVGTSEMYEARCRKHHIVPGKPQ